MNQIRRIRALLGICLVSLIFASGCSSTTTKTAVQKTSSGDKQLVITLDSNPTTGYTWTWTQSGTASIQCIKDNFFAPSDANIVGAPGQQTFTFTATRPGTATLTFVYARSWENEPPENTVSYSLIVNDDLTIVCR